MWEKNWKNSIALGDIASWNVLMCLKIVTKWREIKKSKLKNSLTNWPFQKFFHILFLRVIRVVLLLNFLFVLPYLVILILLLILWGDFPAKKR